MTVYLDFEQSLAELEGKIKELQALREQDPSLQLDDDIVRLQERSSAALRDIYSHLEPWQKCRVARHPQRPRFLDYAQSFDEFVPLCGDRVFGEDAAILGGFARSGKRRFMLIGHERGHDLHSRLQHNFGMGRPEGYRKVVRLLDMAQRFGLPVITLVDTPGAYPGIDAEERGQAEAIARATQKCLALGTPLVSVIIGEGGSGGAVSLAAGDFVLMPEHSVYSVISPEGCASILWRDSTKNKEAAAALNLTADRLLALNVIDKILPEPLGGGHRGKTALISTVRKGIDDALETLRGYSATQLRQRRRQRFINMGQL